MQSFIASPPFQDSRRHASAQHIFLAFFWLAMANSAINPLIYFQMNAKWVFYIAIAFPFHLNLLKRALLNRSGSSGSGNIALKMLFVILIGTPYKHLVSKMGASNVFIHLMKALQVEQDMTFLFLLDSGII